MRVTLPYGKTGIVMDADRERVIESRVDEIRADGSGAALVEKALCAPIGSRPLRDLAAGKKNAVIIISDHTRPVPSRDILPPMLEELRDGNPEKILNIGWKPMISMEDSLTDLFNEMVQRRRTELKMGMGKDLRL